MTENRFSNKEDLGLKIFKEQIRRERKLNPSKIVFLDRSVFDVYAYSLHYLGYIPK